MNRNEREKYFLKQEDELLKGGATFSEWCTLISKSVYDAFINGADLATIITATTCIETYLKTENPGSNKKNLAQLIDAEPFCQMKKNHSFIYCVNTEMGGFMQIDLMIVTSWKTKKSIKKN